MTTLTLPPIERLTAAAESLRTPANTRTLDAVLMALELKRSNAVFAHAAEHALPGGRWLVDSYHCSRYNTQTRRLTADMFTRVVQRARDLAGVAPPR